MLEILVGTGLLDSLTGVDRTLLLQVGAPLIFTAAVEDTWNGTRSTVGSWGY